MQKQVEEPEQAKRKKFVEPLLHLASSEVLFEKSDEILKCYKRLDEIYYINEEHTFRHFYSDIYSTLRTIKSNVQFGTIAYLLQNIEILRTEFRQHSNQVEPKTQKLEECLKKIYDHTSLEIARMDDSDGRDREISLKSSIKDMENKISELKTEVINKEKDINNNIKAQYDKIENIQKNYVGILSIFAAVIVAFTAGTAFSSSVLNNIDKVTIYRLVFICLLLGSILINILYVLFSFILIIVKGNKLDIKACLIPNTIIGVLLIITMVAWYYGAVEKRNGSFIINEKQQDVEISLKIHDILPDNI